MSSLTGPGPLPPLLTNPVVTTDGGTPIVLTILAAQAVDQLVRPLIDTLQGASNAGSVITGTVEATSSDGTVTVLTPNGTSITVHHPPELPLELGSKVVLRLIPTASVPQALLLAVNGRPVLARTAPTPSDALPPAPFPAIGTTAITARAPPPSPALANTAVTASLIATISLEDEAVIEATLSEDWLVSASATDKIAAPEDAGSKMIAVLIRPAPAKLGQLPVPNGTRYLVTLRGADSAAPPAAIRPPTVAAPAAISAVSTGPAPRPAATPLAVIVTPPLIERGTTESPVPVPDGESTVSPPVLIPAPPVEPDAVSSDPLAITAFQSARSEVVAPPHNVPNAPPPSLAAMDTAVPVTAPEATRPDLPAPSATPRIAADQAPPSSSIDDDGFRAQPITLAGRVVTPRMPDETLVETALGTLALPLVTSLPAGSAIQLRVSAVASPHPHGEAAPVSGDAAADTVPPSLIEELTRALAPAGPGLVAEIHQVLAIEPGNGLAAAIIGFLTGTRLGAAQRPADMPARRALLDAGRTDLAIRLDRARDEIGTVRPQHGPDGWTVTILPFPGVAGIRPMQLYRKRHQDKDGGDQRKGQPGERFMLEVELKRLGPLQFDGLVRERRFDLVVRSRDPLLPALQQRVEQVFQDGLLITGWQGEIGFGRIGPFPMIADPKTSSHVDLGA